jgi:hypothetical protein
MVLAKSHLSMLLVISLCGASVSSAKEIFVSPKGDNGNSGSSSTSALATIAAASARAAAGDTVYLLPGTYSESLIPVSSGTASAPITYKSYGPGAAVISNVHVAILISSQSYITIDGINVSGGNPSPQATVDTFVVVQNANHILVRNGTFQYANGWAGIDISALYLPNGNYYATVPKASMVTGATSYVTIRDNIIDSVGTYAAVYGDVIQVGAGTQRVLVQGNTMTHGGHDLVEFDSDYGVLQSNVLNASFADTVGGDTGYRSIEVQGSFNVIQGNFMEHARQGGQGRVPPLASVRGQQNIFRQNVLTDGIGEGVETWCSDVQPAVEGVHIYNNTVQKIGAAGYAVWAYTGCPVMGYLAFVNNIVADSRIAPGVPSWARSGVNLPDADIFFAVSGGNGGQAMGLGPTAQSVVKGNLFAPKNGGPAYVTLLGTDGRIPMSVAATRYPQLFSGNVESRPVFVKAQPTNAADFQLQPGSPGLGSGVFLTNVIGSGTSNRLVVQDSLYFSDGNNLIPGDTIQLQGTSQTVQIVSIDRSSNALVLSSAVAFKDGQGVALPYSGTAPDIGAGAGVAAPVRPSPPLQLTITH